jgi:hypothetical protein
VTTGVNTVMNLPISINASNFFENLSDCLLLRNDYAL